MSPINTGDHGILEESGSSSALLECAISGVQELLLVFTSGGDLLDWNRRLPEVTGYSDAELQEMSPAAVLAEDDEGFFRRCIEATERTCKERSHCDASLRTKEGSLQPYAFTVSPLEKNGRQLVCMVGRAIEEGSSTAEGRPGTGTSSQSDREEEEASSGPPEKQLQELRKKNALLLLMEEIASASNEAERLEEALQEAVDNVCEYTGWPVGHVYILPEEDPFTAAPADETPHRLVPTSIWSRESRGRFETFREVTEETPFEVGEGLPGRVLAEGQAAWIEDVTEAPNFPRGELAVGLGVHGAFAFPVFRDERVVAVLEFFSREVEAPDEEFLRAMASIGTQLGQVAEREEARRRLEASEKRYRFLTESAVDAVVVADEDGRITDWNRGATDIFGYGKNEILGEKIEVLMPDRHREPHRQGMERVRRTGEGKILGHTLKMEGLRKDGTEFPLELSLSSWEVQEERYFAAIIRDISERYRLQEEVLQVQEEERRRLGQELHDSIASKLTGANLRLGLLSEKAQEASATADEFVEELEEAQAFVKESATDMRRLSRGLNPTGLPEGDLASALKGLASSADGVRLEALLRGDASDRARSLSEEAATHLYRIAQEAVSNARKYAEASEIILRLHEDEGAIILEVEDDGHGFDPEETREGLGLRSMRHRADLLGAEFTVQSSPGDGTLVRCRLPGRPV